MKHAKLTAIIAGVVTLAILILQNTETVDTQILFFAVSMPRAALLAVTALIGFACGMLYSAFLRKKQPIKTRT